jgi:hypothetical protein
MRLAVRVELRLVAFRVAGLARMGVRVFPENETGEHARLPVLAHRFR